MAGVRQRGGKNTSLSPYRLYRYEYKNADGTSVAIPIATEQDNTSRSQIVKLTSRSEIEEMEPEEIG